MNGFVAFATNYSVGGNMWHAGNILDIDLDKKLDATAWLRDHPATSGKFGLHGVSRGAEMALLTVSLMARDGIEPLPDAVAVHAPSDTIAGAFIAGNWHPKEQEAWDPSKRAWRWKGSSEGLLPTTPIEIERYDGPLFISHGDKDDVWTVDCTRRLEARLRAAGRTPEILIAAGEGHGFGPAAENELNSRVIAFFTRHLGN